MRIIVHGQQAFGKSVLEALLERGEDVIGVYCEPDREGRPPDPIKQCAMMRGLPVFQPRSCRKPETAGQMASLRPDLCVMAYVTLFVPEEVLNVPAHGSIQYHPFPAAPAPGRQLHQLARHLGRDPDRALHLLAGRRARRRADPDAKGGGDHR